MHKEQLMELHQFFVHVFKEMIPEGTDCVYLKTYEELDVKPHHIHKLKTEQRAAIFLLAACLAEGLSQRDDSIPENLSKRLSENAFKYINMQSEKYQNLKKVKNSIDVQCKHENVKNTV
ncbi:UPF0058 family protein [Methanococcus maripaludis]|jgi:hypothetical protein|uniref:Uncharacterized protein n=4 Tax=Methanococcus maripaludis TaxID=39152 RepID=Q6LYP2_METMP|nr:UPF0058 family protein [Methanococcus maripaludis]MDK2929004.1 hypothetical protein [Methanococcus sp.]AVB75462.1 hypothetical protein MMJJ_00430 [Methanococcus maripaludis]MBA2846835.1 hypothetical protein [Methanococcus maripaludis]MBA2850651.1 hypothetical protein [Methanococcus maripaludis]MBA2858086.1 hypothetical protein [Methanococcus maripaludis]